MFILLASFDYKNSPSKKLLDSVNPEHSVQLRMFVNTEEAKIQMNSFFEAAKAEMILIFSERKNIKKVTVELAAQGENQRLESTFNLKKLQKALEIYKIDYEINPKPCKNRANEVYYFALKRAEETYAVTTVVLISLPPLEHFSDFEGFCRFVHDYVSSETLLAIPPFQMPSEEEFWLR